MSYWGYSNGNVSFQFVVPAQVCGVCSDPSKVVIDRALLEKMRRLVHPDTHAQAGPRTLELAGEVTKALNAALDKP